MSENAAVPAAAVAADPSPAQPAAASTATAPVAAAAEPAKTEAPAAAAEPRFKVKVDGKEEEVTLADLQKHYGLEKSAQARMQSAAAKEKEINEVLTKLKEDPDSYFRFIGKDPDDFAITRLSAKQKQLIEDERLRTMSPEERELHELKEQLEKAKGEKEELNKQNRASQVEITKRQIAGAVIDTLKALPEPIQRNDLAAGAAFLAWESALEKAEELTAKGVQVTPKMIADGVLKSIREMTSALLTHAKDEELDGWLPPTIKGRLAAKEKKAAAVHPSLSSEPQVRGGTTPQPNGTKRSTSQMIRDITLGAGGLKG